MKETIVPNGMERSDPATINPAEFSEVVLEKGSDFVLTQPSATIVEGLGLGCGDCISRVGGSEEARHQRYLW